VQVLASRAPREAGAQSVRWEGNLPGGSYLIQLTAVDADGRQARAMTVTRW
jgi:hypothetical protein